MDLCPFHIQQVHAPQGVMCLFPFQTASQELHCQAHSHALPLKLGVAIMNCFK